MKNLFFKSVLIAFLLSAINVKADHIMGPDITSRCSKTNDSIFTIIINFYRDCRGCYVLGQSPRCGTSENCASSSTVPSDLALTCSSSNSSLGTVSMTRTSIVDITKTCKKEISKCAQPCNGSYPYGIEKHTFEGTIDLRKPMKNGCCLFRVSTGNICCRSVNITTGPSGGFYTYLEIDACSQAVNAQTFADNLADPHAWIERCVRILKDHLHLAAHLAHRRSSQGGQILPLEGDGAARRHDQPDEAASQAGLAATRLANQSHRLAVLHIEAYAIDRLDVLVRAPQQAGRNREIFLQIPDFEQWHFMQP